MNRGWTVLTLATAAWLAHRIRAAWTALHNNPPDLDDDLPWWLHEDHPRTVDLRAHPGRYLTSVDHPWLIHADDPADLDTLLALIREQQRKAGST